MMKGMPKNIHLISNPSILEYDGDISFQLFNSPVIDDLRTNSIFKLPISQNRIDPCLQQIIDQRNLTPIYPLSQPLDLRKYNQLNINEVPNFIIIPSTIGNGFAKVKYNLFFFKAINNRSDSFYKFI